MKPVERRATASLASIFALRMFGLFLVLPVLAVYARDLPGATALAVGLAVGIYGLGQALLQIPFGLASDRFGRKPVITFGILIFVIGSAVAATADTVSGIIVGRALQGAGAVAAAILALTSDLTRDAVRTKAMALIGVSIGFSFLAALMIAPPLTPLIGVPGLFWLSVVLALVALAILWLFVPDAPAVPRPVVKGAVRRVLGNGTLMRLNFAIFVLHAVLTALFVAIPVVLVDEVDLDLATHWKVYVPVMLASVPGLIVLVGMSHRKGGTRGAMLAASVLSVVALCLLYFLQPGLVAIMIALAIFFTGFNALEAMLPSLCSRIAPDDIRGTALGAFNTLEFAGIFLGGVTAGSLFGLYGAGGVYVVAALLTALLLALLWLMPDVETALTSAPDTAQAVEILIGARAPGEVERLRMRLAGYDGVRDATVDSHKGSIVLKIDPEHFDSTLLDEFADTVNIRLSDIPNKTE